MRLPWFSVAAALIAAGVVLSACGGGDSATASSAKRLTTQTPQPAGTPTATPTTDPNDFGPPPVLGGNITAIVPQHGTKVAQAKTRTTNPQNPAGMCAQVTFDGLPENAQWFRVAFDGEEVTSKLVLIVRSVNDPTGATICYSPAEGFAIGRHSVAIAVQDPRNASVPTRQVVAWKFDVTP